MDKIIQEAEEGLRRLYQQMAKLGDFRPGLISVNYRKCGKKNCVCTQPGHRGHGPQYLWNTTQGGKSRAQNLRLGPELNKARMEVENYKTFQRLSREIIEANERICRLRPVSEVKNEEELEALKKKLRRKFIKRRRKRLGA